MSTTTLPPVVSEFVPEPVNRKRSRRFEVRLDVWGVRILFLVIVFGLWQAFAGGPKSALPTDVISRPSSIAVAFGHLVANGKMFSSLGSTIEVMVYSLLIAIPIGAALAVFTASRLGRWLFEPLIVLSYAIPKVGLITLFIILLGEGEKTALTLVASVTLFVYYFAIRQALDEIDQTRVTAFRLMGASRLKIYRSLVLGYAVPQLFSASRVAIPLAFATTVFAELRVSASKGLGVLLNTYTTDFKSNDSMAILVFIMILGYLLDGALRSMLRIYTQRVGLSQS